MAARPEILPTIRFSPERELIEQLFERFGLAALIDHFIDVGSLSDMHDLVLASQLRVTAVVSPRLHGLLAEVQAALGFADPIELFVGQDAQINAGAIHALRAGRPHLLSLTSALVERMDDDELRFVLGHEVGHLAFEHYRARLAGHPFYVVAVHAPLDVLEAREKARGDRLIGLARWQFPRVHAGLTYDFEVNTAANPPETCARLIRDRFDL